MGFRLQCQMIRADFFLLGKGDSSTSMRQGRSPNNKIKNSSMILYRLSIARLLGVVGLFALGLFCLLNASTPLVGVVFSVFLFALSVAPIAVVYRRGERRAFWLGAAICGWFYTILSFGPWFSDSIAPMLITTKMLKWAHPVMIPEAYRFPRVQPRLGFPINNPIHGEDVDAETIRQGALDVLVQEVGKDRPSPLVENVEVAGSIGRGVKISQVTIMVDSSQIARLEQVGAGNAKFVIRRHVAGMVSSLATLWSSPLVQVNDFERVGHVLCGIACALVGGWVGRYFYFTRDLSSPSVSAERGTSLNDLTVRAAELGPLAIAPRHETMGKLDLDRWRRAPEKPPTRRPDRDL